jgi:hypothetical protein
VSTVAPTPIRLLREQKADTKRYMDMASKIQQIGTLLTDLPAKERRLRVRLKSASNSAHRDGQSVPRPMDVPPDLSSACTLWPKPDIVTLSHRIQQHSFYNDQSLGLA